MLIIFHYLGIFIFQILRNRKRLKQTKNLKISLEIDEVDRENDLKFDPPVYRQRYSKVYGLLLEEKWRNNLKQLVDFGCAEFGLFVYIKNLNIEHILFVDIDENLLQEKIGKIEPLLADRLRRRNCPLEISVFRGSVIDPDYRLRKTDVVTAIELIEHLYPDTLDAFPYNIFSFIKPKLVIITTPNADFNVIFNRLHGFRHPDHKFEWTREQFEDWAANIVQRFPDYLVEFFGIGEGPSHSKNIGCCSQAAIFTRKDVLCEKYISSHYARSCQCDKTSPCKGQTTESKLLCSCLCAFCLPDFSVGVCTYLSCNRNDSDAYRPMKTDPKKSFSDTDLKYKTPLSYNPITEVFRDINPSYNIFYKFIQKIDYPYEIDSRSETEKFMETFRYRIRTFSHENSRFYVDERKQCEIPVRDIIYGDIEISAEEVRHLLSIGGYQIEQCIIPETQESEYCIISMPQEMEDITSSSEVTDGYSSKSSECNDNSKFEANIDLPDWDETAYVPKEKKSLSEQGATSSLEPSTQPISDPLFDSGYLKSPSPLETNLQPPQLALQENLEYVETDQFEDTVTTPNLHSDDNKLHLKKSVAKEKFMGSLVSVAESPRLKVDPNRVNELDRFHNMSTVKTFMNNHLKPQTEFRSPFKDLSVAGTSSSWKKPKKFKDKEKKVMEKKELDEPSVLDDAKSITNCIIQNSLNKVEVKDENVAPHSELIRDLSPLWEPNDVGVRQVEQQNNPPIEPQPQDVVVPPLLVENGDLANNNRDNEGNNLMEYNIEEQDIDEGIDLLNDNLEELVPLLQDNANVMENNNDLRIEGNGVAAEEQEAQPNHVNDLNNDENMLELEAEEDSIDQASQEALYDVNSEQDLLEDFDIPPPPPNHEHVFDVLNLGNSVVLVGIHPVSSNVTRGEQPPAAASIQTNTNSFPNWLLQILGSHVVPEASNPTPPVSHDEPHFYCQGDGLGVHPSVMAVEIDEAEDADNDTTTEESSSNNTADFAEVDPGPSDMLDMSSLPEELSPATSVMEENTLRAIGSTESPESSIGVFEEQQIAIHVADGTSLVNEVIKLAVEEVNNRIPPSTVANNNNLSELKCLENTRGELTLGLNTQESEPSSSKNCQDSRHFKRPEQVFSESDTFSYEEELPYYSSSTDRVTEGSASSNISRISEQEMKRIPLGSINSLNQEECSNVVESESNCEQVNTVSKVPKTSDIQEAESFIESERSEYFDPKTEDI